MSLKRIVLVEPGVIAGELLNLIYIILHIYNYYLVLWIFSWLKTENMSRTPHCLRDGLRNCFGFRLIIEVLTTTSPHCIKVMHQSACWPITVAVLRPDWWDLMMDWDFKVSFIFWSVLLCIPSPIQSQNDQWTTLSGQRLQSRKERIVIRLMVCFNTFLGAARFPSAGLLLTELANRVHCQIINSLSQR